jgi:hypothetical protein
MNNNEPTRLGGAAAIYDALTGSPHGAGGLAPNEPPQKWLKFDYSNPPAEGVYWVRFEAPETDCDVDDDGRTVGRYTGETEYPIAMVHVLHDGDGGVDFHDIDKWNLGSAPSVGVARQYMAVTVPTFDATAP